MTNEEMQRTMQFIVEQQAKTEVLLQQISESHAAAEKRIGRLEGAVVTGINLVNRLNEKSVDLEARDEEFRRNLEESQRKWEESQRKWEETRDRLDAFILVLERYIGEGRNGKKSNGQGPAT